MAEHDLAHIYNSREIFFLTAVVYLGWDCVGTVGIEVLQQNCKQREEKEQIWNESR